MHKYNVKEVDTGQSNGYKPDHKSRQHFSSRAKSGTFSFFYNSELEYE